MNKFYDAVVITPTTGSEKTLNAIKSVANQKSKYRIKHLLVVDGGRFSVDFESNFPADYLKELNYNIRVVQLDSNTGSEGFYGHRIYAGFSHLVEEDYVFFLDQDNSYESNHVESLIDVMNRENKTLAFSLRYIYDKDGKLLCRDDCESLGKWPVWNSPDKMVIINGNLTREQHFHVDTSAWAFKNETLKAIGHLWHFGYGGDRRFLNAVRQLMGVDSYSCSGKYSLNYYLDGNTNSASPDFFKIGNEHMNKIYNGKFPWSVE